MEYQKCFDALKKFDDDIIRTGHINNIEESIQKRTQLEENERIAYGKRKEAEGNYKEFLKQLAKAFSK